MELEGLRRMCRRLARHVLELQLRAFELYFTPAESEVFSISFNNLWADVSCGDQKRGVTALHGECALKTIRPDDRMEIGSARYMVTTVWRQISACRSNER